MTNWKLLTLALALSASTLAAGPSTTPPPRQGVDALGALEGTWQSDTINGVSALSRCAWTPARGALLCEQAISSPQGEHRALSLFTFDGATGTYVFYALGKPGDLMRPVPLAINGRIWTYGGVAPAPDGHWYRTINDFTAGTSYAWRQESSTDGATWVAGPHGRSTRLP